MTETLYHRPALAARLSKLILQVAVGSAASSGVFLAAPRRTGKSTFAREDLRPALEATGAIVLYADLWKDLKKDPGQVIVEAVREAVGRNEGFITRLARSSGMERVVVGGLNFSLDKIGLGKDIDLTAALVALSDESKKIIVLIIDEAQHAITTDEGVAALFALKAARDELNSSRHYGLRIVCTGSNRDKLAMLRNSKDQAFFGASMVQFPTLDQDFIDWFCANVDLAGALDPAQVFQLFKESGYRPELLGAAADEIRFDFVIEPDAIPARFAERVRAQADELNANLRKVIHSLTPIQSAVIRVMSVKGDDYAPFEAPTMVLYGKAMTLAGIEASDVHVEVPGVQQALIALQQKKLVWKASRGVYAVDDSVIAEVLRADGLLEGLE
ncbi:MULTISPECIES: ATP-binding protein [Pseudomonas]|uniref:ATP-binding protein n=1 Tax=Pseudomonas taiwanensis TaxID=470150 RepID=A0ABR6V9R2_9PSED|nr:MULTISPECIES: ATP-binding protein [Pseudomonas]MBC3477211.1 ATP-binding protein [Pseudomonas taiwanensis]MBC3491743.1 ATP-binding protein [Pseudomonas taiwanensis]WEZ86370.1 ATP-binding protein [Pseudomonas sp. NyZ480]